MSDQREPDWYERWSNGNGTFSVDMPFSVGDRVRFDETKQTYFQRYVATFVDYSVCIDNPPTFTIFEADRIGVLTLT